MEESQTTSNILMIKPVAFRMNEQTVVNNFYQKKLDGLTPKQLQIQTLAEFNTYVDKLKSVGVNVIIIEDTATPSTPDSIFPNNWVSFHKNGTVGLYPLFAKNRRAERRQDILDTLQQEGFKIHKKNDLTYLENNDIYLEGTGSMILDRTNKIVYAAISERTHKSALDKFCNLYSYKLISFKSNQTVAGIRRPIYHTNVMMCIANSFAIICTDTIDNTEERIAVLKTLENTKKEVILISENQVNKFAGNVLQVLGAEGQSYLVMSTTAYTSLSHKQISKIEKYCPIIHSPLTTIEALGGGGARCMIAEVFLPRVE